MITGLDPDERGTLYRFDSVGINESVQYEVGGAAAKIMRPSLYSQVPSFVCQRGA